MVKKNPINKLWEKSNLSNPSLSGKWWIRIPVNYVSFEKILIFLCCAALSGHFFKEQWHMPIFDISCSTIIQQKQIIYRNTYRFFLLMTKNATPATATMSATTPTAIPIMAPVSIRGSRSFNLKPKRSWVVLSFNILPKWFWLQ